MTVVFSGSLKNKQQHRRTPYRHCERAKRAWQSADLKSQNNEFAKVSGRGVYLPCLKIILKEIKYIHRSISGLFYYSNRQRFATLFISKPSTTCFITLFFLFSIIRICIIAFSFFNIFPIKITIFFCYLPFIVFWVFFMALTASNNFFQVV